jgi:glycine/D-amino acid oxidase-like deaminating enzyme/nitrite reductase/ring-hydroxylating ferredoxin subunit
MESLWRADTAPRAYRTLPSGGLEVDVAIVGGGLTGVVAGYLLKKAGYTVAVLESRRVGGGETGSTTAHLTALQDVGFRQIASRFGREGARRIAEQGMAAISFVEKTSHAEQIDCDFRRLPAWVFTEKLRDVPELVRERRAARDAGMACHLLTEAPLPFEVHAALRFDGQAQYHPLKFLHGLAARIEGDGSGVFEQAHVVEVKEGVPCRVRAGAEQVRARWVLMATDAVTVNRFFMQTKLAPYRTYAVGFAVDAPFEGLFYDTESPYHYVRTHASPQGTVLIVGGADHRVGEKKDTYQCYDALERWTRARFCEAGRVVYRWSGQVEEPVDGLPFVGRNSMSSRIYVATGFSGTGMVNAVMSAHLISALIDGKPHPLSGLLDATRIKPLASAATFIKENVDFPRHLITDRLPSRTRSVDQVLPGQGKLVGQGGRKLAVYRDEGGQLHAMSAACPHMGCHVHWNAEARSWDCPCHGSRFDCKGEILHGPAVRGLKPVELSSEEAPPPAEPEEPGAYP